MLGFWGVVMVLFLSLLLIVSLGAIISSRDNALPLSAAVAVEPIPPQLIPIYHAAGAKYHVPWAILAGINRVETNFGRDLALSSAGAIGWMQFEPATWAAYGVDADGDGKADPYDPVDAIFSAAKYLSANDAKKNPAQAVFQYNHSSDYVREVLQLATIYQTWNPLSSDWVWPVADTRDSFRSVSTGGSDPFSIAIHCPPGTIVRAIHQGTVASVTGTTIRLDLADGLTVTEQGLQPSVTSAEGVHAGESLGTAGVHGVTISIQEQATLLPVLWSVSPMPPSLAQTPVLSTSSPPQSGP